MTCLHNHDQILEFLRKIFLKGFQIYQNYLCALMHHEGYTTFTVPNFLLMKARFTTMNVCTVVTGDISQENVNDGDDDDDDDDDDGDDDDGDNDDDDDDGDDDE